MLYATQTLFGTFGSSFSVVLLALVLLLAETIDDPLGIRIVVLVAGVLVSFGFRLFLGSRLTSTVIVMGPDRQYPAWTRTIWEAAIPPPRWGVKPVKNISQISKIGQQETFCRFSSNFAYDS